MNYICLLSILLFCCKTKQGITRKQEQPAISDTTRPKIVCTDTSSTKTRSGFYLVMSGPNKSKGTQLFKKNEYYILDSIPIITMIDVDTTYKEFNEYGGDFSLILKFNGAGAQKWGRFTSDNINNQVGLVVCNKLVSIANIIDPIYGGVTSLYGQMTENEIDELKKLVEYEKEKALQEYIKNYR